MGVQFGIQKLGRGHPGQALRTARAATRPQGLPPISRGDLRWSAAAWEPRESQAMSLGLQQGGEAGGLTEAQT